MLAHPTLDQLHALGLHGLAKGFKDLEHNAEARGLDHAEWLGLLLEYELTLRRQKQFETRARVAKLRHPASVEDVNYQSPRGLDRALFLKLAACDWIAERRNLLITGASGLGKSWLACALGHKACRENLSVLYTRMPRLFADLAIAHGDARYARLLRHREAANHGAIEPDNFALPVAVIDRQGAPGIKSKTGQVVRQIETDDGRLAIVGRGEKDPLDEIMQRKEAATPPCRFCLENDPLRLGCGVGIGIKEDSFNIQPFALS